MTAKPHAINLSKLRTGTDWHPFEIVAAVRAKGTSLQRLARESGYHPNALHVVSRASWPKGERIIAATLGLEPKDIWPSRYSPNSPNAQKRRGARDLTLRKSTTSNANDTPVGQARNVDALDRAPA
jgi:Ner family transcriptional regulator